MPISIPIAFADSPNLLLAVPRLYLVSSPLLLPSLLISPQCNFRDVHSTALVMMPTPCSPIPPKHQGLFQEHQWESKLGASYPRHSLSPSTPVTCTAPHSTALHHLLTRWQQPGPHAERRLQYIHGTAPLRSMYPYLRQHRTSINVTTYSLPTRQRNKRHLSETEMYTERGADRRAAAKSSTSLSTGCHSLKKLRARHLTPLHLPVTLLLSSPKTFPRTAASQTTPSTLVHPAM